MKRRFLASLLALGMLLSLGSGAAFAAGEDGSGTGPATVGTFAELQAAVQEEGANIVLSNDITIEEDITFGKIYIDFAKHSIIVPEEKTLTIQQDGVYRSNGYELLKIYGNASIAGGDFKSTMKADASNDADGKGIIVVDGPKSSLHMTTGYIDARETSGAPGYALHGLTMFRGATVTLGNTPSKPDAEQTGPRIDANYAAIGTNNLLQDPSRRLTLQINGGYYWTYDASGPEKYNAVIYMSADMDVNIDNGDFRANCRGTSGNDAYVFSIPYKNTDTKLVVNNGTFRSDRSTILRTAEQETATNGKGNTEIGITGGFFQERTLDGEFSIDPYATDAVVKNPAPIPAEGLAVTASALENPQANTVKVEVKADGVAVEENLYYKIVSTSTITAPNVGVSVVGWNKLTDFTLPNVENGKYIAVVQVNDQNKVVKFGISGETDDGCTPSVDPGPTIGDLTVNAERDDEGKITLGVTETSDTASKRYYKLYESEPDKPDSDVFTIDGWEDLTANSFVVTDEQKYVAVAEVKDGKITHWGKASIPGKGGDSTDPGDTDNPDNPDKPDIKSLTVKAERDKDNKVKLTVTETAAAGSKRYYRLYESDPGKPVSDDFSNSGSVWTELSASSFAVTDAQKYVAVAEVKDGKITHWGTQSIPAKTETPTDPDKPTDPVLPTDRYWISSYSNSRGTVSTSSWADAGDTVWVRLYPRSGYYADGLTATDRWGDRLDVYYEGNDWYTFTMPASNVWLDPIFISNYVYTPSYNTYTPPVNSTPAVPENNNRPSYNSGTAYYRDVPANAWYYSAVQYAYRYNLMSGTSNGVFSPNQTTNRAMVVTMLYNMAGRPSVSGGRFDDVASDAWYADAVVWAAKNGITSGYGGFFRPGEAVTREQMALMLYNYAKLQGCDVSAQSGLSGFRDTARITPQAQKAVSWANAEGLLNGVSGGRLDPKGLVTRAQIASILMNFRENVA